MEWLYGFMDWMTCYFVICIIKVIKIREVTLSTRMVHHQRNNNQWLQTVFGQTLTAKHVAVPLSTTAATTHSHTHTHNTTEKRPRTHAHTPQIATWFVAFRYMNAAHTFHPNYLVTEYEVHITIRHIRRMKHDTQYTRVRFKYLCLVT